MIVGETYTLREIEPASGYAVAEDITFVVEDRSEDGTYTGQTFTMTDEMTSVTFMKFDANDPDTGVGNATIAVYDKSGKEVARATTDETGACTITKLPVGTYTWKEVAAPDGYALNPETYTFTINRDGSISGTTNFENDYVRIGIVKVDKKSKDKLEGAEFTLYDANGNEIETKTTDENGRVEFVKLAKGEYTIKETKAPSGYKKTDEEIKFTVTETYVNGNDYEVENTKKSPSKSHGGGSSSSSTVEPPASEPAPTGDNNQILGYLTLSALCLAFVAVIIKKRRNK